MNKHHATEAAGLQPLTVDTTALAHLLGVSKSWVEKRVEERSWTTGTIPVPFDLAPRRRLWLRTAVVRWAEDRQARAEARIRPAQEVAR